METPEKMKKLMEIVEEYTSECGRMKVHMILNDGHEDEWTATTKVAKMVPVAYMGVDTKPRSMPEYLSMIGFTPAVALQVVNDAWNKAREIASKHGIEAPRMGANMWDCYWCVAMMLSDYWVTTQGDLDVAAMLAYQYLTDPDK